MREAGGRGRRKRGGEGVTGVREELGREESDLHISAFGVSESRS